MLKDKRSRVVTAVILSAVVCLLVCFAFILSYINDQETKTGIITVEGQELRSDPAVFTRSNVLVPLIPVFEGYGYTVFQEADNRLTVIKNNEKYIVDPEEMTMYLVESSRYEKDKTIPEINILTYPVGIIGKNSIIKKDATGIMVDYGTMVGILENMHEEPQVRISWDDYRIAFSHRGE